MDFGGRITYLMTKQGAVGGVLFLLGINQFGWLRSNIGDATIMGLSLPYLGDVTLLKILGVGGIWFGGRVLWTTIQS